jgi:protein O-mannosyl-transferase
MTSCWPVRARVLAPLILVLAVVLTYVRTLEAPFVWDDHFLVQGSPLVTELHPVAEYFKSAFWNSPESGDSRVYYRPLVILSLAIDYSLHGGNAAGFHLTNSCLHALNAILFYALLRRNRTGPWLALFISAAWALHPRLTEAAAWIAGRTDVLATTFVLVALLVYRRRAPLRMAAAACLMFLGLLSKEVALAGVCSLVAAEVAGSVQKSSQAPALVRRRLWAACWTAALPCAALIAYWMLRVTGLSTGGTAITPELTGEARVMLALAAIGHYTFMVFVPWLPRLQIGDVRAPDSAFAGLGVLVLLAFMTLGYRHGRWVLDLPRPRRVSVVTGSALGLVALGLVLHIIPISVGVTAADRFLYLPLIGLGLATAPCLQGWLRAGSPRRAEWGAWGGSALLISCFAASYFRIGDWCSEPQLWLKAYRTTPARNTLPANELANLFYRAGLMDEAAGLFARVVPLEEKDYTARANLANVLAWWGMYEQAGSELKYICKRSPGVPKYCLDAGLVELHKLEFAAARQYFSDALARTPNYREAKLALAQVSVVEELVRNDAMRSSDARLRLSAQFQVAQLAGRNPEALILGRQLLADAEAPPAARRAAAEYWAHFGPPGDLVSVLGEPNYGADLIDEDMLSAVAERVRTADELRAVWAGLEIPVYAASR